MPYVLGLGLLIILLSWWRYLSKRQDPQSYRYSIYLALFITFLALVYLGLSGRLVWIIGVFVAWLPWFRRAIAFHFFLKRARAYQNTQTNKGNGHSAGDNNKQTSANSVAMSKQQALDILGLDEGADQDEVKAAYHRLMKRLHPDVEGSDYLSALVNQARDILIKK